MIQKELMRGARLRRARLSAGLTQAEAAEALGVHKVTISNWEREVNEPEEANYARLAKLYHTTPSALRYGEGEGEVTRFRGEPYTPTVPRGLRGKPLVWLHEFLAELARAGATKEQIDAATDVLTNAEAYAFYAGGLEREPSEEEIVEGMKDLATGIRLRHGLPIPPRT